MTLHWLPPEPVQLEDADRLQQWLTGLPASLEGLAAQAAEHAQSLQRAHGFSLHGLAPLLGGAAGELPAAAQPLPPCGALGGSLLLTSGVHGGGEQQQAERQGYAAAVLQRFEAKLAGEPPGGSGEAAATVEDAVERLIAAATSPAKLARMYEGWMPWV